MLHARTYGNYFPQYVLKFYLKEKEMLYNEMFLIEITYHPMFKIIIHLIKKPLNRQWYWFFKTSIQNLQGPLKYFYSCIISILPILYHFDYLQEAYKHNQNSLFFLERYKNISTHTFKFWYVFVHVYGCTLHMQHAHIYEYSVQ